MYIKISISTIAAIVLAGTLTACGGSAKDTDGDWYLELSGGRYSGQITIDATTITYTPFTCSEETAGVAELEPEPDAVGTLGDDGSVSWGPDALLNNRYVSGETMPIVFTPDRDKFTLRGETWAAVDLNEALAAYGSSSCRREMPDQTESQAPAPATEVEVEAGEAEED